VGRHRKPRSHSIGYRYQGRHRVVTPKNSLGRRTLIALSMSLSLALYPALLGEVGKNSNPPLSDPSFKVPEAFASEEVITEHTDHDDDDSDSELLDVDADVEVDLPVDELLSSLA
jgi:hypothetical protein